MQAEWGESHKTRCVRGKIDRVPRTCIFCDNRANTLEHVFPDWINKLILSTDFEGVSFTLENSEIVGRRRHRAAKAASLTARMVCSECNHGWMADLEGRASRVLAQMMIGQKSTLDHKQQLLAAQWAVKTAMVAEATQRQPNSFSQEDRELVRGPQGRPPLRARVSIAAYSLDEPNATRYTRGLGRVEHKGQPFMDLYVHTIQVLQLVFSIRGTDTFPATANQSLSEIVQPRYFEIPIFPPVERCIWPPAHTMDNDTLMEYSGANNLDPG